MIRGLVFKKHAAHKHMPTKYKNPRLLLIRGALGLSSSGLSSFESMDQVKCVKWFNTLDKVMLLSFLIVSPMDRRRID